MVSEDVAGAVRRLMDRAKSHTSVVQKNTHSQDADTLARFGDMLLAAYLDQGKKGKVGRTHKWII